MDMDKIAGAFNKLFHDYGMWIMLILVALVVTILLAIGSFATQRAQDAVVSGITTMAL